MVVGGGAGIERGSLELDKDVRTEQHPLAPVTHFSHPTTSLLADLYSSKPEPSPVCRSLSKSNAWDKLSEWQDAHAWEQRELEAILISELPLHQVMDNLPDRWDIHRYPTSRQSIANVRAVTRRWFEAETKEHQTRVREEVEDLLSDLPPHQSVNSLPNPLIGPTFATLHQSTASQLGAIGSAVFQEQNALDQIEFRNPALGGQAAVSLGQDLAVQHSTIPGPSQQMPTIPNRPSSWPEHSNLEVEASHNKGSQESSSHPSNLWSILQTTVSSNEIHSRAAEETTLALQNAIDGMPGRQANAPAKQNSAFSTSQQTLPTINNSPNQNASSTNGAYAQSFSSQDNRGTVTLAQISTYNAGATANSHASMVPSVPTPPRTPLGLSFTSPPRSTSRTLFAQHLQAHNAPYGSDTLHAAPQKLTGPSFPQNLQRQNTGHSQNPSHTQTRRRNFTYDPVADANSQAGTTVIVNGQEHVLGTQLNGLPEPTEMVTAGSSFQTGVNYQSLEYHNQPSIAMGGDMKVVSATNPISQQQGVLYSQAATTQSNESDQNDQPNAAEEEDIPESTPTHPRVRLPPQPPAPSNPTITAPIPSGSSVPSQGVQAFAQMASQQPLQQVQSQIQVQAHAQRSRRGQGVPGAPTGPRNYWPSRRDDRWEGGAGPSNPEL
ncbi:hypothetical protein BDZ45DRAFT_719644 [Acephala macrosclerotiorum]|nr:hypothetical protein BDZ45DRAFT_719644 [Acephala macrosclerotiorum]